MRSFRSIPKSNPTTSSVAIVFHCVNMVIYIEDIELLCKDMYFILEWLLNDVSDIFTSEVMENTPLAIFE